MDVSQKAETLAKGKQKRGIPLEKKHYHPKTIAYVVFCLWGILFLFCFLTEKELAEKGNILWTKWYTLKTLGISAVLGGAFGAGLCFGMDKIYSMKQGKCKVGKGGSASQTGPLQGRFWLWLCGPVKGGEGRWKVFLSSLAMTFCSWIPAFLAYYPGVCAYDAVYQTGQIAENYYIDHHPIFHTLLIKGAMMLGENVFGSVNGGIGFYTLCQMLFLAAAFAFGMGALWQRGVRRVWLGIAQLYCMFYPFHWYMSVSMTKDTMFAACFLTQLIALGELLDERRNKGMWWVFFFSTVGMILFRNNGKYAFLVFLAVLIPMFFFGRKKSFWGRLLLCSLGALAAGAVLLQAVFRLTDASQGDRREMLSIPIQQLARTMVYHGGIGVMEEDDNTMEASDKALINDFILNEAYRNYRPDLADPVKSNTNTYVARYRAKEFITVYLGLLAKYPGDFINAALAVNAGYLYPEDTSHAYVNAQEGQAAGGGYVQTRWEEETLNARGIYKDTKWQGLFDAMEKWADDNAYLRLPVLKYFFVPGVVIWLYLLLLCRGIMLGKMRRCMPLVLVLGYFLTLFLGPTVQLRYIYPVMIAFPFLMLWTGERLRDGLCEGGKDGR